MRHGLANRPSEGFAKEAHSGQCQKYDKAGVPYIEHCREVAETVREFCLRRELDGNTSALVEATAWLHDAVEDCDVTHKAIEAYFGIVVARWVGQ